MKILNTLYKNIVKIIVGLFLVVYGIYLYKKYMLEQEIYSSYNDKCNTKH